MQWICIDSVTPGVIVICFEGGFDVHVYRTVAELRHRRSGELLALFPVASA